MALTLNGSGITSANIVDGTIAAADLASGAITSAALPVGTVVGGAMNHNSTAYYSNSGLKYTVTSVSYTPKFASGDSDIYLFGVLAHGLGPVNTNLDPYGIYVGFDINGSNTGIGQYVDVFAGSGSGVGYGPEWDIRTTCINYKHYGTWTVGTAITFGIYADNDQTGGIFINRCAAHNGDRATSSIHILEIKK